jgi:putative ABC transport system ATP-binding protein
MALAHNPRVLFADEPCANLDSETLKEVLDLLRDSIKGRGKQLLWLRMKAGTRSMQIG